MRARALFVVAATTAVVAGPLVGVAGAAVQYNNSSTPATASTIAAAPYVTTRPATATLDFNEPINATNFAISTQRSSIQAHMVSGSVLIGCGGPNGTGALSADSKSLVCTPFSNSPFADGVVRLDYTACAALPDTGCITGQRFFGIDTQPPSLTSRAPLDQTYVQSSGLTVTGSYSEPLNTSASSIAVKNPNGNTVAGSSVASGSGITWTPTSALAEGKYTVDAVATDVHGLTSQSTWTFTVDNTAPAAPTVTTPPAFVNLANEAAYPVSGTADHTAGNASRVRLFGSDGTNTVQLADVAVGNGGNWSANADFTQSPGSSLVDGPITFTAKAVDDAGNVSSGTTSNAVKDTVAPTLSSTIKLDPSTINASSTTDAVSGNAEPGSALSVSASNGVGTDTTPVTTVADASTGDYGAVIDTASLADGTVTVKVVATDAAGNTTTQTTSLPKDTTPTGAPSITTFGNVNAANVGTPRPIAGTVTGSPVSVDVWVTDTNGASTPHTSATPSAGSFNTAIDVSTLADGPLTAHAVAIDSASNPSAPGTMAVIKDTVAPDAPTYSATLPAYVNNANKSAFPVSGTAEPNSSVAVTVTDTGTGNATHTVSADNTGAWATTFNLGSGWTDGAITISTTATDAVHNVSTAATTSATRDTSVPATPSAPTLTDPVTASTSTISGNQVTVSGTGTNGDTMLLTLTSDGGAGQVTAPVAVSGGVYSSPVDISGLPDGQLSVSAVQASPAGNASATSPVAHAIKDTTALAVAGSSLSDGAQVKQLAGGVVSATYTEQLGNSSTATLSDSFGALAGTASLSPDLRTISFQPTDNPLAEGAYTVTFSAKDRSGTEPASGLLSTVIHFTVDRTAPAAPAVGALSTANQSNVGAVPVSGTVAEPGGKVTVDVGDGTNTVSRTIDVGNTTSWATTIDVSSLADGAVHATATQDDAAGNTSPVSAVLDGTKDTVAPNAPTLSWTGAFDAADQTAQLSGAGEDGSTVTISVDDTDANTAPVVTTTPVSGGAWSKNVDVSSLSDGTLTATVWQTDAASNVSGTSTLDRTKDTVVPAAPTAGFSGPVTATDHTVTLSGTGEDGDAVAISVDDTDGNTAPVTAPATVAGGTWSTDLDLSSLSDGTLTATVTQTDGVGNQSSSVTTTVAKDTVVPGSPTIHPVSPANAADAAAVPVSGTGASGDTVHLSATDGTNPAVTKTVDVVNGAWSTTLDLSGLSDGSIALTAIENDGYNDSSDAQTSFAKDVVAPDAPSVGFSGPVTATQPTVTLSGAGEDGDSVSISVDDTDVNTAPVTDTAVVSEGAWSKDLDLSGLSDGTLTATVTQTDAAGNTSSSAGNTAVKDVVAPNTASIDAIGPAGAANATALPVSGLGTSGDTVRLVASSGSQTLPAVTTDVTNGTWATTLDVSSLPDGPITITANAVDEVGNVSALSTQRTTVKDTVAPTVRFTGAASPFTLGKASVTWAGGDSGSGLASYSVMTRHEAAGHAWSAWQTVDVTTASLSRSLTSGEAMCFRVTAIDAAGNASTATASRCVTRVFDDRAMTASAGWKRVSGREFYLGTATVGSKHLASLRLPSLRLDRAGVVAQMCPGCGKVAILVGSTVVKTINLASSQTRDRVIFAPSAFAGRTASVRLVIASSGKPVRIDGVGATKV